MAKRTPRTLLAAEDRDILRLGRRVGMPRPGIDLTDRERKCLEAVHQDVEAREALRFLARKTGRTEKWWITNFVVTTWMDTVQKEFWRGSGDSEPKELLEHAARVLETAQTIRQLNSERFWNTECPDVGVFEEDDLRREKMAEHTWALRVNPCAFAKTKRAFENLPHTLEMYARSLRYKAWLVLGFHRLHRREGNFQHRMVAGLLECVRRLAGRMYRNKVAAILRVIYPMAGLRAVEGESLRKRDRRKQGRA